MGHLKFNPSTGHLLYGPNGHLIHTCGEGASTDCQSNNFGTGCLSGTMPCSLSLTFSGINVIDDCTVITTAGGTGEFPEHHASLDLGDWSPNGVWELSYHDTPFVGTGPWQHRIDWGALGGSGSGGSTGGYGTPVLSVYAEDSPLCGYTPFRSRPNLGPYADPDGIVFIEVRVKRGTTSVTEGRMWVEVTAFLDISETINFAGSPYFIFTNQIGTRTTVFFGCSEVPSEYITNIEGEPYFDCRYFEEVPTITNQITFGGLAFDTGSGEYYRETLTYCHSGGSPSLSIPLLYGGACTIATVAW